MDTSSRRPQSIEDNLIAAAALLGMPVDVEQTAKGALLLMSQIILGLAALQAMPEIKEKRN